MALQMLIFKGQVYHTLEKTKKNSSWTHVNIVIINKGGEIKFGDDPRLSTTVCNPFMKLFCIYGPRLCIHFHMGA